MSVTLLLWLGLFGLFAVLALSRPAWGVALYMLTYFACPLFWWWGKGPIGDYRWNLYGGAILLVSVLMSSLFRSRRAAEPEAPISRLMIWVPVAILFNATLVHFLLSSDREISTGAYILLAKFVLLYFMIVYSCSTRVDLNTILLAIVLGAGYIGYEATINDRGKLSGARLEGIGAPGADGANQLASLMVMVLPLAGGLFLAGNRWHKLVMLPVAPMILNVILLCNSRGAFLGALGSVFALLLFAPGEARRRTVKLIVLGGVATWLLLGDPRIVERFLTTFVSAEERDSSAESRLTYWQAGFDMIADYPLGAGGDGFKKSHGSEYLDKYGVYYESRAVHNGFINEACEWGLQGFVLRMLFVGGALVIAARTTRQCIRAQNSNDAVIGAALIAGMVGFLITCVFGDRLDNEWGYWMCAIVIGHARVCGAAVMAAAPRPLTVRDVLPYPGEYDSFAPRPQRDPVRPLA